MNNAKDRNDLLNSITNARLSGNLSYKKLTKLEANNKNLIQEMRNNAFPIMIQNNAIKKKDINFAFIQKGSRLDLGPYIDFK